MKEEKNAMVTTKHYAPGQMVYYLSIVDGESRRKGEHYQINKGYVSGVYISGGNISYSFSNDMGSYDAENVSHDYDVLLRKVDSKFRERTDTGR